MRPAEIRKLCEKYGTQKSFAERIGVAPVHLSKVLNGVHAVTEKMIARIKKAFPEEF